MTMILHDDTICAPATILGTGAVSIIRLSGPSAFEVADKVIALNKGNISGSDGYSLHFGRVFLEDGSLLDEVIAGVYRAPRSYTGEDMVEITCHASKYIGETLLRLLIEAGARMAEAGEFTKRAYLNGKMDLAQAEAVADVVSSQNEASHRVAMNQMKGAYSKELAEMRERLLEMTSLIELELDFSEEDVEFAQRPRLETLVDVLIAHVRKLTDSFRYGNALRSGIPVVIAGPANAGKSTLLNALTGDDRALVSEVPGTTRDTIEEVVNIGGHSFRFIDTAGLRETEDEVEKMGIGRSWKKLSEAFIVIFVLDISADEEENGAAVENIVSKLDIASQKFVTVFNKADIFGGNINVSILNKTVSSPEEKAVKLYISAKTGEGVEDLEKALVRFACELSVPSGQTVVTNMRHYEALLAASKALENVRAALATGLTTELLAEELRSALTSLGSILGDFTPDEVLGNIFARFCVGK